MKQITLYIRDDQHEKLKQKKNKSEVVREGLDLYYNKEDDNMSVIKKLEQAGYSRVERTTRDDYWTKAWSAEDYYDEAPKDVKIVLSRVYPKRQAAEYINCGEGTAEEIANATKVYEEDYHALINSLENNSKGDDNMETTDLEITGFSDFKEQLINRIGLGEQRAQRLAELKIESWFGDEKEKIEYFDEFGSLVIRVQNNEVLDHIKCRPLW